MLAEYIPHPFLVASALLFGFVWWTFVSERKRVKKPHPKTLHPVRLVFESALLGLFFSGMAVAFCIWNSKEVQGENALLAAAFGLSWAIAYFISPYMGYNLLWTGHGGRAAAPFLALLMAMLALSEGLKVQVGL